MSPSKENVTIFNGTSSIGNVNEEGTRQFHIKVLIFEHSRGSGNKNSLNMNKNWVLQNERQTA